MASAVASAAHVIKLLPVKLRWQEHRVVNNFGIAGSIAELAAGYVVEQQVDRLPIVGRALQQGLPGLLWNVSKAMTLAGLALSVFGKSRKQYRAAAILGTAGAIALRFAIFHAGKASARDPRATFHLQRQNALAAGSIRAEVAGRESPGP
jgi:hypothetical protein